VCVFPFFFFLFGNFIDYDGKKYAMVKISMLL